MKGPDESVMVMIRLLAVPVYALIISLAAVCSTRLTKETKDHKAVAIRTKHALDRLPASFIAQFEARYLK